MAFVDEAVIFIKAGSGGKGCESLYREKYMRHPRPDGGDGGHGGDVVVVSDRGLQTLLDYKFRQHYKADNGRHGGSKGKRGRNGKEAVLRVPVGTLVWDQDTGLLLRDLALDEQSLVVAKGGAGGRGNINNKEVLPPKLGVERKIRLELKLIADVGLIGFPNAGKSTLINAVSKVKSKIANYPFTTKQPILGILNLDEDDIIIADLPGLIEGAHSGRGLGDRFLKHAERTRILVHLVDMSASEGRDPLEDYEKIIHELQSYGGDFLNKQTIVVANKMDVPESSEHLKRFKEKHKVDIFEISALEKNGLDNLVNQIQDRICKENSQKK